MESLSLPSCLLNHSAGTRHGEGLQEKHLWRCCTTGEGERRVVFIVHSHTDDSPMYSTHHSRFAQSRSDAQHEIRKLAREQGPELSPRDPCTLALLVACEWKHENEPGVKSSPSLMFHVLWNKYKHRNNIWMLKVLQLKEMVLVCSGIYYI